MSVGPGASAPVSPIRNPSIIILRNSKIIGFHSPVNTY
jgi:hypothetical protein